MPRADEEQLLIHLDVATGRHLPDVLRDVAQSIEDRDGDETGYARHEHGEDTSWRLSRPGDGAPIDPRQREAAAALLMAVDLPLDATVWVKSMFEGCLVNPGMKLTSMPSRVGGLREARRLIDEMLVEADAGNDPNRAKPTSPSAEAPSAGRDDGILVLRTFHLTAEEDAAVSRIAFGRGMSREDLVVQALRRLLAETAQ